MATETPEEFIARGGKVNKSEKGELSLAELLNKEGLIDEEGAKAIADLITSKISESVDSKLKPNQK